MRLRIGALDKAADRDSSAQESGVHRVVVLYSAESGVFDSVDATFDSAAGQWLTDLPESATFIVQLVDGAGNVAWEDKAATLYRAADLVPAWLRPAMPGPVARALRPIYLPVVLT